MLGGTPIMATEESPSELAAAEATSLVDSPELPEWIAKVSHHKKRSFLLALTVTPNLTVCCRAAGISYPTMYNWAKAGDEVYNEAYEIARDLGIKAAEAEAWKRATDGTIEDVYGALGNNQGSGVVGQRRVKSDTMLIFMLKGAAPRKYRDNLSHEVSGPNGGPIPITEVRSVIVDPKGE